MTRNIFVLTLVLGVFLGLPTISSADTPTVTTQDEQLAWMQDAFDKHVMDVVSQGNKVWFKTDGFFVKVEETEWKKEFVLGVSEEMMRPDDHGSIVLKVQSIDADGVVLTYESTFDHRSVGPDKITKDEGQFKIFWRKSDGPA